MSNFENSGVGRALQLFSPSRDLVIISPPSDAEPKAQTQTAASNRLLSSRFHFAAAAALAVVLGVGAALCFENRQQATALAQQASENESLVHTVKSLKVRLDAIDTAMSNSGLADLRRSVSEIKSTATSSRELNGALNQLSERVDKLDHEASAKVDKLTERVDHATTALSSGLSTRIEKLEQKIVATPPAPSPAAQTKQPVSRPKFDNVAMDRTSSIEKPRPLLRGYVVLDAREDIALIGGRYGEREVRQGDVLPGAGRVESIQLGGNGWVVTTSEGLIASADFPRY